MLKIIIITGYVFACFKWGNWRNWQVYYSTILYVIIGDLVYNFIFYNFTLWKYEKFIGHTFTDVLIAFSVFPCVIILFFTHLPHQKLKQFLYIVVWTCINTALEYICHITGYLSYSNNWNILWSAAMYFIAFILVLMHFKRPLITWIISDVFAILTMLVFEIPFSTLK